MHNFSPPSKLRLNWSKNLEMRIRMGRRAMDAKNVYKIINILLKFTSFDGSVTLYLSCSSNVLPWGSPWMEAGLVEGFDCDFVFLTSLPSSTDFLLSFLADSLRRPAFSPPSSFSSFLSRAPSFSHWNQSVQIQQGCQYIQANIY